jgi:hypothetical protein
MNWLRKKVIKWVREDWENEGSKKRSRSNLIGYPDEPEPVLRREYQTPEVPGMDIRVQNVTGGMIVSITRFNNYSDRVDYPRAQVYLLREEENLGEALAKIITQESLRG